MEIKENWQKEFFINAWDIFQDRFHINENSGQEIEFIDKFASERGYKKILDVPCGTGRVSVELAKKGYDVTGIDFNPNAIKRAKSKAKGLNAVWMEEDMRNMSFNNEFDLVTCMWSSIGYFTDEENANFLKSSGKALKPGGAMILDTPTLESIMRIFNPHGVIRLGDSYIIEEREYDFDASSINMRWTFFDDGKQFSRTGIIRLYSYKELIDMMKKAGFNEFISYSGFEGKKYTLDSPRLELCAIKKG